MSVSFDDAWMSPTDDPVRPTRPASPSLPSPTRPAKRDTLQVVVDQLIRLNEHLEEREKTQTAVTYASLAVALMLLVAILHTYSKLNHATECLLWHTRRA